MASKIEDHGAIPSRRLADLLHSTQEGDPFHNLSITEGKGTDLTLMAHNLAQMQPFLEYLPVKGKIPIDLNGHYLQDWQLKSFLPNECINARGVTGIGVKTGLHLLCLDFDGVSAFNHAYLKEGIDWVSGSFETHRDDDPWNMKSFFIPTPKQIKQLPNGEFKAKVKTGEGEQLEVFLGKSQMVIAGKHPDGGNYFWPDYIMNPSLSERVNRDQEFSCNLYAGLPESLSAPSDAVWDFVLKLARKKPRETSPKNTCNADWRAARPCPICNRDIDDDCRVNKAGDVVLCHRGNTFHPPTLAVGEILTGTKWAYCGEGESAIGTHSTFKIHRPTTRSKRPSRRYRRVTNAK